MIHWLDLRPDDRVLLVSIPDIQTIEALARRLEHGVVVGLGAMDEVHAARKAASHLTNVMFQPGSAEEIPWQSAYFSKVVDLACDWQDPDKAAREVARVLAEDGSACLKTGDSERLIALGFLEQPPAGEIRVFTVPSRPGL